MSDTILGGDITVSYLGENRQKSLTWTGSTTGTQDINDVYSALADLMDESIQMDDGSVMSAQTPVEYTIGIIDAGDLDPWYITYDCMQHITGGALKTSGWTRNPLTGTGSGTIGIVVAPVTSGGAIVAADVGNDIVGQTVADTGTLLEVINFSGSTDYLVIRPDSNADTNSFDSAQDLVCNVHTSAQSATATTGEQIWANFYTVTPIEADTHVYFYQGTVATDGDRTRVTAINDTTQDWWSESTYDRCIFIRDYTTASNPIIDSGYVTAFVRKGNTLYDNFELQASNTSGGRNPVPLSASSDLNNTTGTKSITTTAVATDDFTVGNEILGGTSEARGILTLISGSSPTYTLHYYPIGDPQTAFSTAAETITDVDATGSATKNTSAPADQGPALSTWYTNNTVPTVSFTAATADIDDDGTNEYYGVTIDCQENPLTEVYEWCKYATRNGETTNDLDGINGEAYIGAEVYLKYSGTVSGGTIAEGDNVVQATSGATGVVISHDTTNKVLLLRDARGTFSTSYAITSQDAGAGSLTPDTAATTFTPSKQSPFGTFAGGTFFGARGVLLTNYLSADENSFQLIDATGTVRERPTTITLTVTNLTGTSEATTTDDRVAMFRLTAASGSVKKTEYVAYGGEAIGDATLDITIAATADTPGKSAGGVVRIVDATDNQDYRIRFSSWANNGGAGSTGRFTLANFAAFTATGGTTTTVQYSTGGFTAALKRGDLVYNSTQSEVRYVASVDSDTQITVTKAFTSATSGNTVEINCVPIVPAASSDYIYVPLIDQYAATSTASASIVYVSTLDFRTRVRNVANTTPIKPFEVDGQTTGTSQSIATIRTTDTIYDI